MYRGTKPRYRPMPIYERVLLCLARANQINADKRQSLLITRNESEIVTTVHERIDRRPYSASVRKSTDLNFLFKYYARYIYTPP